MQVIETNAFEVKMDDLTGIPAQVNEYRVTEELGEGAYGKVYLCEKEEACGIKKQYAMKVLNKSILRRKREFKRQNGATTTLDAFQKVQKEIAIMKKLAHTNLTKMYEVIDSVEDGKLFLILEYVSYGQLMDWDPMDKVYICQMNNSVVPTSIAQHCIANLVLAVDYLHVNNICHRDIKPENILLNGDGNFKLSDFGVAHMFDQTEGSDLKLNNTEGTYHFIAPECMSGEHYNPFKVDIWALGVTLYAMLYGTIPFGRDFSTAHMPQLVDAIKNEPLLFPSHDIDFSAQDLISKMLQRDPNVRITLEEIKMHPWLNQDKDLNNRSIPQIVHVTTEEIESALTPTNNFILMSKIKMKLSSHLARIRSRSSEGSMSKSCQERIPSPCMSPSSTNSTSKPEFSNDLCLESLKSINEKKRFREIIEHCNGWSYPKKRPPNYQVNKTTERGCNIM